MVFPKHMFRHPGPYGVGDASYDVIGCADAEEEASLIGQGWRDDKDFTSKSDDDAKDLRAEYTRLAGKKPFMGWDNATLREKIAALEPK